jgi:hypothetical protein
LSNSLLRKSFGLLLLHSSEFWFSIHEGVIYRDFLNLHFVLVDVFVVPRSYNQYAL